MTRVRSHGRYLSFSESATYSNLFRTHALRRFKMRILSLRCFELNTSTSNYGEMRNSEGIIRHARRYGRPQLEKNSELSDSDGGNTVSFVQPIRAFKSRRVTRKPELSFITPFQSGFCNLQRPQQPTTDRNPKRKKKGGEKRKKRKSWSEINSFERQTLITCLLFIAEEYGYGN